jgi:hypothetical protein
MLPLLDVGDFAPAEAVPEEPHWKDCDASLSECERVHHHFVAHGVMFAKRPPQSSLAKRCAWSA